MGVERVTVTAKYDIENVLFVEGLRANVFIGVSRSGMLNLIITWVRLANHAGDITLNTETVKKYIGYSVHPAEPKYVQRESPIAKAAKMAWRMA